MSRGGPRPGLFAASSPGLGNELWQPDGTAVGTQLVADMSPGPRNTTFGESLRIGTNVYFTADDGTYGREVWLLSVASLQGTILERFGYGCSGRHSNVPELFGVGLPRIGEPNFALQLERGAAQAQVMLQLGVSWRMAPIGGGCIWWPTQPLAYLVGRTDAHGAAGFGLPVPSDPGLLGLELIGQAAMLVGDDSGVSIAVTNAVHLLVGR